MKNSRLFVLPKWKSWWPYVIASLNLHYWISIQINLCWPPCLSAVGRTKVSNQCENSRAGFINSKPNALHFVSSTCWDAINKPPAATRKHVLRSRNSRCSIRLDWRWHWQEVHVHIRKWIIICGVLFSLAVYKLYWGLVWRGIVYSDNLATGWIIPVLAISPCKYFSVTRKLNILQRPAFLGTLFCHIKYTCENSLAHVILDVGAKHESQSFLTERPFTLIESARVADDII